MNTLLYIYFFFHIFYPYFFLIIIFSFPKTSCKEEFLPRRLRTINSPTLSKYSSNISLESKYFFQLFLGFAIVIIKCFGVCWKTVVRNQCFAQLSQERMIKLNTSKEVYLSPHLSGEQHFMSRLHSEGAWVLQCYSIRV